MGMTAGAALCFLHLFSGGRDKLGEALLSEAKAAGIEVTVEAHDLCKGDDLTTPEESKVRAVSWGPCRVPLCHLH